MPNDVNSAYVQTEVVKDKLKQSVVQDNKDNFMYLTLKVTAISNKKKLPKYPSANAKC